MPFLLVEVTAAERDALGELPDARTATAAELEAAATASDEGIDVVVVGSAAEEPVTLVQWAHRAVPEAGVAVFASAETVEGVRRRLAYAPGVPLDLLVLVSGEPATERLLQLQTAAVDRRHHHSLLAAVSTQWQPHPPPRHLAVTTLGSLLEHAPLGVVLCDPQGRVLGWNRRVTQLFSLAKSAIGTPVDALLPGSGPLITAVMHPGAGGPELVRPVIVAVRGIEAEVSAVASQLNDGRPVALLLVVDVTSRRAAERARDRLAGHVGLLGRVSESLTSTLDIAEALRRLTHALAPAMADLAVVHLVDESGAASIVAVHHGDPALAPLIERARQRQAVFLSVNGPSVRAAAGERVLLTGLSQVDVARHVDAPLVREIADRVVGSSVLAVPLPGRDRILGALALVSGPGSPELTASDLEVAAEIGRRAGVALDNARLYARQRDLATELQRSLLTEPPERSHGQIVVRYVAAATEAQVGGDWYDAFLQPDGATVLVIGDVVGHDTRAAAAMGQLRGLLRGIGFTTGEGPAELLRRVDEAMAGLLAATTATAVVARLEEEPADAARLRWSNAGHPPPIVMYADGRVDVLHGGGGGTGQADLLLGLDPATDRRTWELDLPSGSTLLMYTDGLVERRGESLDDGLARLVQTLAECGDCSLDQLCDTVLRTMVPAGPDDDVALVAVRLHPRDRPRPPEARLNRVPPHDRSEEG